MNRIGNAECFENMDSLAEALLKNHGAKVAISVVGAGGKTSFIHFLAKYYCAMGMKVLVSTTTHMKKENGFLTEPGEIRRALAERGYAFAGTPDPENQEKIIALSKETISEISDLPDVLLIEADGARRKPFKAPYPWEPVLYHPSSAVIIVLGMNAAGNKISSVCYNPEGVAEAAEAAADDILTEELMEKTVERTYLRKFSAEYPGMPVYIFKNFYGVEKTIHCIYLASGFSRRYGGNKLVSVYSGKKLYRHVLDKLMAIKKEEQIKIDITVVTQYAEILQDLKNEDVLTAVNTDPSRGISSSLQVGIRELEKTGRLNSGDVLVFFVADQPHLKKESIENFITGFEYSRKDMGCMGLSGEYGNPCAFSLSRTEELKKLTGEHGGKTILKKHPDEVFLFDDIESEELEDIDRK